MTGASILYWFSYRCVLTLSGWDFAPVSVNSYLLRFIYFASFLLCGDESWLPTGSISFGFQVFINQYTLNFIPIIIVLCLYGPNWTWSPSVVLSTPLFVSVVLHNSICRRFLGYSFTSSSVQSGLLYHILTLELWSESAGDLPHLSAFWNRVWWFRVCSSDAWWFLLLAAPSLSLIHIWYL